MQSGGFGRKGTWQDEEMAQRRAAFVAAERARAAHGTTIAARPAEIARTTPTAGPIYVSRKSMGLAYLLWFVCGQLSAHRFYLGYPLSGTIQASLWVVSWVMILTGVFAALLTLAAGILWVVADAFLIPSMHRQAQERLRRRAVAYAFA